MTLSQPTVCELCSELQGLVRQSAGGGEPLSGQRLDRARQVSEQLRAAAARLEEWRRHRRQILDAVAASLAEPSFLRVAAEVFGRYVFPAVLLLLARPMSAWAEAPEAFERTMLMLGHLVHDPGLTGPIAAFLQQAPPPYRFLAEPARAGGAGGAPAWRCRLACEAALRLVLARPTQLRGLWDWAGLAALLAHEDLVVRRLARAALSHVVGLGVVASGAALGFLELPDLGLRPAAAGPESWRAGRQRDGSCLSDAPAADVVSWAEGHVQAVHGICFSVPAVQVERSPFVSTAPDVADTMRALLLAVGVGRPVLLSGAAGVGKTAFLQRASELLGRPQPVFLYCDEQTDLKMLFGTYVCGETVGEFIWRPGIITEALCQGQWLVLEDVDRVPAEVLAALLPLVDSNHLLIPDRNQRVDVHQGFRLFATFSTGEEPSARCWGRRAVGGAEGAPAGEEEAAMQVDGGPPHEAEEEAGRSTGSRRQAPALVAAFTRVRFHALGADHMDAIIAGLYPELKPLCARILASAATLSGLWATCPAAFSGSGPTLGLRALLRWCRRLRSARLVLEPVFVEEGRAVLLREAAAALLGRLPDPDLRRELLAGIAQIWSLARGVADTLLDERPSVSVSADEVAIGHVSLHRRPPEDSAAPSPGAPFAYTSVHARVLQALASSIRCDEAVLLVGDTGTGKTSVVQHIGQLLGKDVLVYNFNEQSDIADLVGGFRPVDVVLHAMSKLMVDFTKAFEGTFSRRKNAKLLERARGEFVARRWGAFLQVLGGIADKALQSLGDPTVQSTKGSKAVGLMADWERVRDHASAAEAVCARGAAPRFEFSEGVFVRALRTGAWIVLDEINLAPGDVLQRIQGLIERLPGCRLSLPELGDEHLAPHAEFRIFACMNPPRLPAPKAPRQTGEEAGAGATVAPEAAPAPAGRAGAGAGKKELPPGIRSRFTEIFVDEVHTVDDISRVVRSYLERDLPSPPVAAIVGFYSKVMSLCRQCTLLDGTGKPAYFSLRNLTRALRFALCLARRPCHACPAGSALAQGLAVGFATVLDTSSGKMVERLVQEAIGAPATAQRSAKADAGTAAEVQLDPQGGWLRVEGYWIRSGPLSLDSAAAHSDFIITGSVRRHLQNISRMLSAGRFPILLEGPTSSGKTSLVRFLARVTGHEFVRINNHEHTDLQEYIGQYVCDPATGQLVFQEGVLVRAARSGHWVVLDELNLAPSEVLEALNRLLDDNRELYIPDTGETVKPHEEFMVFATQNPAGGLYGGRKQLSRAFRNRFTEIFISELPMKELEVVLHHRCQLPESFVRKMLAVYQDLQSHRSQEAVFLGKQSFMTVRDLLRWGHRRPQSQLELAVEGFTLLGERLRKDEDKEIVRKSLSKHCSGVKDLRIDYTKDAVVLDIKGRIETKIQAGEEPPSGIAEVVWTPAFCRMCALVGRCIQANESALLVGETGGGKTMACQVLSWAMIENGDASRQLRTVNCHQQTETADFIGSLRPVRGRDAIEASICTAAEQLLLHTSEGKLDGILDGEAALLPGLRRELKAASDGFGSHKALGAALCALLSRCGPSLAAAANGRVAEAAAGAGAEATRDDAAGAGAGAAAAAAAAEAAQARPEPARKRRRTASGGAAAAAAGAAPAGAQPVDAPAAEAGAPAAAAETAGTAAAVSGPAAAAGEAQAAAEVIACTRRLLGLLASLERIFEWADGALVEAMRTGGAFLADEISLAEDSVLERLNSVLETDHFLLLAEKPATGRQLEEVRAGPTFRLLATMNPGGDFGKRELSPALRNRFTEIWVEPIDFASDDAETLVASQLSCRALVRPMIRAVLWFNERVLHPLSIREVLGWSHFVSSMTRGTGDSLQVAAEMYLHGGCMVLVDSLGLGNQMVDDGIVSSSRLESEDDERSGCLSPTQRVVLRWLVDQIDDEDLRDALGEASRAELRAVFSMGGFAWVRHQLSQQTSVRSAEGLTFGSFRVSSASAGGDDAMEVDAAAPSAAFDFEAHSTACNVGRVVRALQQPKAILLEGPPGLGKTATVQALAQSTGRRLLRVNLSEQTDLLDLLGSDLPVSGSETASFKWSDGALLRAMRNGDWVLLDEINLAPQATLEGLNALLDHRREIFLPAIGQTVVAHAGFRLFAAQNPVSAGGGRKGLPRSFLNRFIRVVLTPLTPEDLRHISQHSHGDAVGPAVVDGAVKLLEEFKRVASGEGDDAQGQAKAFEAHWEWDWNLRDVLRLCDLLRAGVPLRSNLAESARLLFVSRLRAERDRASAAGLLSSLAPAMGPPMPPASAAFRQAAAELRAAVALPAGPAGEPEQPQGAADCWAQGQGTLVPSAGLQGVRATASGVQVGTAVLARRLAPADARCLPALELLESASALAPLACQTEALRALAHAASDELRWPALVVGGPAVGKCSVVRWLAAAARMPLQEVPLTASMDASELLGCFEQVDSRARLEGFCREARCAAEALARLALLGAGDPASPAQAEFLGRDVAACFARCAELERLRDASPWAKKPELVACAEAAEAALRACAAALPGAGRGACELQALLGRLCEGLAALRRGDSSAGRFEWADGPLVRAVQEGRWALLSHAEQAAPAVLDRLNSLLEPGGFLLLTESGEERVIKPHPDFRIFFTMTPGGGSGQMSRALRNRCIEIFMDAPDCARCPCAGVLGRPEELPPAGLEFLPEVPRRLAGLLGGDGGGAHGAALRWAARRLADDLDGAGEGAPPVPPPAFLLDAGRVLSCQLALRPALALQVSLLHVAAQTVWRYLQKAALSEAAAGTTGQAGHDSEARASWARSMAASAAFTWRALLKCARLFAAAASRGAFSAAEADERGALERAFVQTYVAEMDGGGVEEALFSALFQACAGVESMPSFRWLAEATLRRPESLQTGPAPSAEAEVARQSGPLFACVAQGAGQWELLVQLRLFLERSSPADAPLRLRRVELLGEPVRAIAGGCRALLEHRLTGAVVPGAIDHVRGLLGARSLGDSPRHSCQDGWALVDSANSGGAAGSPALAAGAAHLRELLRCARALAVHLLAPPVPAAGAGGDAWSLSCRFQEGMVPLSRLPHPVLAVAQPLVEACSSGLVEALSDVPAEPSGDSAALEVLVRCRLGLAVVAALEALLRRTIVEEASGAVAVDRSAVWRLHEAKALCLVQQLHDAVGRLPLQTAPWLQRARECFAQLRGHLASCGLAWDPDAQRLKRALLPLTDSLKAGGLRPPLTDGPEFFLERLVGALAAGRPGPVPGEAAAGLPELSGLLACSLIRRRHARSPAWHSEAVDLLAGATTAGPPAAGGEAGEAGAPEPACATQAYHPFLVLEMVELLVRFANSGAGGPSFAREVEQCAAQACRQLRRLGGPVAAGTAGAARAALVQAAAELQVLRWLSGGEGPWGAAAAAGLVGEQRVEPPEGPAQELREWSLLAVQSHAMEALSSVFADESAGSAPGLAFVLSPATLPQHRSSWKPEGAVLAPEALLVKSGFSCAWALNLCTSIAATTSIENHAAHQCLLDSLATAYAGAQEKLASSREWATFCRFLASQLHGLRACGLEAHGGGREGHPAQVEGLLLEVGRLLSEGGNGEQLSRAGEGLEHLKAAVEGVAARGGSGRYEFSGDWPMGLAPLVRSFLAPALELLARRCRLVDPAESDDLSMQGAAWALAAMWRLQSGGGAFTPGGVDECEVAAQARAGLREWEDSARRELAMRAQEELAVNVSWGAAAGAAADLACERRCLQEEAVGLSSFCRLRPPLDDGAVPERLRSQPAVAAACTGDGGAPPSYGELCQEMASFSTTIARPDRILRLLAPPGAEHTVDDAVLLSELANLKRSSLAFLARLRARFPLHGDLVDPVALSVRLLVHGLHLVHRRLWSPAPCAGLGCLDGVLQAPALAAERPQEALGEDVGDGAAHPEAAIWWMRWLAVQRQQTPGVLLAPGLAGTLEVLRSLGQRHRDEEDRRAQEQLAEETPFRLAKEKKGVGEGEEEEEAEAGSELFPGAERAEVAKLLGIPSVDGVGDAGDGGVDTEETVGNTIYDVFAKRPRDEPEKDSAAARAALAPPRDLGEDQIWDICDLCLQAFGPPEGSAAAGDAAGRGEELRAAALDASLELLVLRSVAWPSEGSLNFRAQMLPSDVAARILPSVMLRVRRVALQLQPAKPLLEVATSGRKHYAHAGGRHSVHKEAVCDFYGKSNPGILLQLAAPLAALLARVRELLGEFEAHPSLLAVEGLVEKMRQLRVLQTTPMSIVTMLEVLLGRAAVWEEAACRAASLAAQLRPLEALVVRLRERQLIEWQGLRQVRERHWERQGAKWWLHLVEVMRCASSPRELADELLKFLRTSPVAQFRLRLRMLLAAGQLHVGAEGPSCWAGRVVLHVHRHASKWLAAVDKALSKSRESVEKEVQDLAKIARWDLSNYTALKESVTRSHSQLGKCIKRFDESLQELVDTALISGAPSADGGLVDTSLDAAALDASSFVVAAPEPPESAGQLVDDDAFWGDRARVAAALPAALRGFTRLVSRHILPDLFCFEPTGSQRPGDVGCGLCAEAAAVMESLQDPEVAVSVKRRRLQGLRDECKQLGIFPKPLADDALDVMDFFSAPLVLIATGDRHPAPGAEGAAAPPEGAPPTRRGPPGGADAGAPAPKRRRSERAAGGQRGGTDSAAESQACDFDSRAAAMWQRSEGLTHELVHLVLRLHSIGKRPDSLPGADVQLWLGIAAAAVHVVRLHRGRCVAFSDALDRFSATCGAALDGPSAAVERSRLAEVLAGLDRLLEACMQARLVAAPLGGALDEPIGAVRSAIHMVLHSPEYRAYFAAAGGSESRSVRVRACFLRDLLALARRALGLLDTAAAGLGGALPGVVAGALAAQRGELGSALDALETAPADDAAPGRAGPAEPPLHVLRGLLLTAQRAQQQLRSDPSLSRAGAAASAPEADAGGGAEEGEEDPGPTPQLGLGRSRELGSLLEALPLASVQRSLELHLEGLPAAPTEAPLAPFAQQTLLLGRAVLACALESSMATAAAAVGIVQLVCALLEKGLGKKVEEGDGEGEGADAPTEWAAGTGQGEGDGVRDITEEITDDAQLEGTRNEEQEKKEPPEMPEDGKEDTAREVGFDLDTEAQAVPQQEEGPEGDPDQKKAEDELDREQGEVDLNAGGKLDEKMWNGRDDEMDEQKDGQEEQKGQEENIEAHGAKGEGEADTTAKDEDGGDDAEEGGGKQDKEDRQPGKKEEEAEADAEAEADQAEPEGGQKDKDWDGTEGQFDVNMQNEGQGGQDDDAAEGAGECDADSDFMQDGGEGDASGAGSADDAGEDEAEGSEQGGEPEDVADLDGGKAPYQPPEDEAAAGEEAKEQDVAACAEGDDAQPADQAKEEGAPNAGQEEKTSGQGVSEEPPGEAQQVEKADGPDTGAQEQAADEKMFGGTQGAAASFQSTQAEDGAGQEPEQREQAGAASAPDAGGSSAQERPSERAQQAGAGARERAQPSAQEGPEGADRRLQKVDILRDANEGDAAGERKEEGAEKGLHMADSRSGADALGECKDFADVKNQALGAAEQEGEEAAPAAAVDEEQEAEKPPGQKQALSAMALEQPPDQPDPEQRPPAGDERGEGPAGAEAPRGSSNIVHASVAALRAVGDARPEEDAEMEGGDAEDAAGRRRRPEAEVQQLWGQIERCAAPLAAALCEQLRIILEPTLKGRLQGYYRTGKRICMRRVIPFIASNYRRDKIWLRRTKPSKREYQILVAIDNSRSMQECGVGPMALQTLCIVCQAMAQLDVGEYAVLAFGSAEPRVLLPLGAGQKHAAAFGWEQARPLLTEFTFEEESAESHNRSFADMMRLGSSLFDERNGAGPVRPFSQVMLLISDGRFNKAKVRPWVHAALARQQLPLLVVVDSAGAAAAGGAAAGSAGGSRGSLFDLKAVSYEDGQCKVLPYLADFPFPYYVVVQDIQALPAILSDVLKQWFELAASAP